MAQEQENARRQEEAESHHHHREVSARAQGWVPTTATNTKVRTLRTYQEVNLFLGSKMANFFANFIKPTCNRWESWAAA